MTLLLKFLIPMFFIIIFHEAAHLAVAKLFNVGVEVFSIGFGKRLCGFKYRGTDYRISLLPFLGGYCRLEDEMRYSESPTAFTNKRYIIKLCILVAGCVANLFTGFIALFLTNQFPCLFVFAQLSIWVGILNLTPLPGLDGSHPFLLLLEKPLGKKRGLEIMQTIVKYGYAFLIMIQIYIVLLVILYWPIFKTLLENY